jgi:hypothetical protein
MYYMKDYYAGGGTPKSNAVLFQKDIGDGKILNCSFFIPQTKKGQEGGTSGVMLSDDKVPTVAVRVVPWYAKHDKEPNHTDFLSALQNSETKTYFIHEFTHFLNMVRVGGEDKYDSGPMGNYPKTSDFGAYINHPEEINARYMQWVENILVDLANKNKITDGDFKFKERYPSYNDFYKAYYNDFHLPNWLESHISDDNKKRIMRRAYKLYDHLKSSKVKWDEKSSLRPILVQHREEWTKDEKLDASARKMGLKYIGFGRFADIHNRVKYIKKDKRLIPFKLKADL